MSVEEATIQDRTVDSGQGVPESLRRVACLSLSEEGVPEGEIAEYAPEDPVELAREIRQRDRITECVVLVTCSRVEIYASTRTAEDVETALRVIEGALGDPDGTRSCVGLSVAEHLARVACGLESPILGEDEILGQVTRAFETAKDEGLAEGALSRIAETAVRVGRECRDETGIDEGEIGYASAVCRFMEEELDHSPDRVLIVGAGEMADAVIEAITRRWRPTIDVANRSVAFDLTTEDGAYWPLVETDVAASSADAVVSVTGAPDPVLSEDAVENCKGPVIDLANPPDLTAEARERACVTTLEEVTSHVKANAKSRRRAVDAVEERVDGAIDRLVERERENRAEDVLRDLHRKAARTRERQVTRALARLEDGEDGPEEVLEDFASALTGRLLADPTEALREAARDGDGETIAAAHRLFDLDGGEDDDR